MINLVVNGSAKKCLYKIIKIKANKSCFIIYLMKSIKELNMGYFRI